MGPSSGPQEHVFGSGSRPDASLIADVLRRETVGGSLLLLAATVALVWANSPWSDSYTTVRDTHLGPAAVHLDLTVGQWAAEGLLAVFFFVAGLELKRELLAGDLRDPRQAALPVAAAVGGMIVPALLYLLINRADATAVQGWAIPIATDIAFALAVLAVIGRHLPSATRAFLLTLAVVDDLLAISVIAVFFSRDLQPVLLLLATVPLVAFGMLVQRRVRSWWLLLPLAAGTWTLVHASGVHATVAGVLLAFTVPVLGRRRGSAQTADLARHFDVRWRPVSAGVAVPVFALFSAGVTVGGLTGLGEAFGSSITIGIVVGLVVGKPLGVLAGAYLTARLTRAALSKDLSWGDVLGLSLLAGIGFTVSLLIGELAFGVGTQTQEQATIAVLTASLLSALLAAAALGQRNRRHRRRRTGYHRPEPGDQPGARPAARHRPEGRPASAAIDQTGAPQLQEPTDHPTALPQGRPLPEPDQWSDRS